MTSLINLDGGTVNHIRFDKENGIVYKEFVTGNGVEKQTAHRLTAEWWSMKLMDIAPAAKGMHQAAILMSFIDGEKHLDDDIRGYPECVSASIYRQSGETLKKIHNVVHVKAKEYHFHHQLKCADLLLRVSPLLQEKGIDAAAVYQSLQKSYHAQEIDRLGLVWTHGDYWLNNFIGKRVNGTFRLNGVIDWELAGLGSPYEDFALVKMSIEDQHEGASEDFWKGYGMKPIPDLQRHFSIVKTMEWMITDGSETNGNYDTPFYQKKLQMIRESL